MSADQPQLEPGERVVVRTGLHPMSFVGALTTAAFIGLVVALLILHNDLPVRTDLQIALAGLLLAGLCALPSMLRWRRTAVTVTDRRVLAAGGLRGQHRLDLPLAEVAGIEEEPGLTGRFLDHGALGITARDGRTLGIGHLAHARAVVDAVRRAAGGARRAGGSPPAPNREGSPRG
jgi:hypothetical protein